MQATSTFSGTGQNVTGLYNATHKNIVNGGVIRQTLRASFVKDDFSDLVFETASNNKYGIVGNPINIAKDSPAQSIFSALAGLPNGSRGELSMHFMGSGSGHSMAWEIIKGEPVIFDCQIRKMFDSPQSFTKYATEIDTVAFTRLDNVDLNYDFLLRWVKNLF